MEKVTPTSSATSPNRVSGLLLLDLKRSMPAGPIMSLKAVNALFDSSSSGRLDENMSGFFMSVNTSGVLTSAKALKPSASFALLMSITWW